MTTDKHYFIEENEDGKFAVRAKGSHRASGLCDTQKQAEELVERLNPNDKSDVERVRNTKAGDVWVTFSLQCGVRSIPTVGVGFLNG